MSKKRKSELRRRSDSAFEAARLAALDRSNTMADASRHLMFGLIALQVGLIDQAQLVAAFQAWARDKTRALADFLADHGDLDNDGRAAVESMVALHLKKHGSDPEKSLASIPGDRSARERLAAIGDRELTGVVTSLASRANDADSESTRTYSVGSATSGGQRFRIVRPHARGGLGEVFVALDSELNREVALKQILDQHADDPSSRARFVLEAEITGGLEHPGIVPIYGLGSYGNGRPYYAMRFIRGESLKDSIAAMHSDSREKNDAGRHSLTLHKLLRRFTDLCNAIEYAHTRGVIHRDIKPANVIVGKHGETLVVDWGLAKALGRTEPRTATDERTLKPTSSTSGSAETLPGSVLGTPAYMSPEQAAGDVDRSGPQSDIYSLGATLFYLLTGKPPIEGDDLGAILNAVREGRFPTPRSVDPSIDRALEAICLKAMAVAPADRYATAKALAEDVERWAADEPVSAWREPPLRRARRWGRRNRTAVAAAATAILAAFIGLASVLAVKTKANGELSRANQELSAAKDREAARFAVALEAIKLFHGEVGDDLVLKADEFKPLRDKLLQGAADFYRKLEGLLKDQPDRVSREALGRAYFALGGLTSMIGDESSALAAHRKSLAVRRSLASGPKVEIESRVDVARSLLAVAWPLVDAGQPEVALAGLEEARDLASRLPPSDPNSKDHIRLVGSIDLLMGIVLARTGKTASANAAYERSIEALTRLAELHPDIGAIRDELATSFSNFGVLKLQTSKPEEAMAMHMRSLTIRRKRADENPGVIQFQAAYAGSHLDIGILKSSTGKPIEAIDSLERALKLYEKLFDDNPHVADFRKRLATTLNMLGPLMQQVGKPAEALAFYRRSLPIRQKLSDENPHVAEFRRDVANTIYNIGNMQTETGRPDAAMESYLRALRMFKRLVEDEPTDVASRHGIANCHVVMGQLFSQIGKPSEAEEEYRQAVAIYEKLSGENPADILARYNLALNHFKQGGLLAQRGRMPAAEAEYRLAIAIRQKLADENPSVTDNKLTVAAYRAELGFVLFQQGKVSHGEAECRAALAIISKLAGDNPAVVEFKDNLATSHARLGTLLYQSGKFSESEAEHRVSLAMRQKLVDDTPSATGYREALAVCHIEFGYTLSRGGKPSEAEIQYRAALAILQKLADQSPTVTRFRAAVAQTHRFVGDSLSRMGKSSEAEAESRLALAINQKLADENPGVTGIQRELASSCSRIGKIQQRRGRVAEARASFRTAVAVMERLPTLDLVQIYDLACYLALWAGVAEEPDSNSSTADGRAVADRAMDTLRRAVAAGYRDRAHMQVDTDLDALRDRDDFKLLLLDVAIPAEPFARLN
jgi:eukaryotic-like serine/threonine-protein kinase